MIDATTIMTGGRARMHGRRKYLGRPETLGELPESVKLDFAIGHARIASSLGFLSKNYRKPIGVTDLMKVAGLSRRGFLKAFRKHTGRTPGETSTLGSILECRKKKHSPKRPHVLFDLVVS